MARVVYIHGNGTTHWSSAWAGWLKSNLEDAGFDTFFETMPDSVNARAEYWLPFMAHHIGIGSDDIVVGWSSGAVAAMRYAEARRVAGMVLVSPCHTDLGDDMEKQSGYFNEPWLWDAIRRNSPRISLITSDDDPFIPQGEFDTIAEELAVERVVVPSGGHFMGRSEFPDVLQAVEKIAADR